MRDRIIDLAIRPANRPRTLQQRTRSKKSRNATIHSCSPVLYIAAIITSVQRLQLDPSKNVFVRRRTDGRTVIRQCMHAPVALRIVPMCIVSLGLQQARRDGMDQRAKRQDLTFAITQSALAAAFAYRDHPSGRSGPASD